MKYKRDLSKPLGESGDFDPRDRNKDGTVDPTRKRHMLRRWNHLKQAKELEMQQAAKAEATDKKYPTKSSKQLANANAKAKGKIQPFPSVGTGDYSGTGGFPKKKN